VKCPSCHIETPPDAEFCPDCGASLLVTCPQCHTSNHAGNRFCKKCGHALGSARSAAGSERFAAPNAYTPPHLVEKILTSRSALHGERKLVTVLFVDVSGFTALSEKLDPEDVHALMDRAFELMLGEIHHYEGTVNQFLGDGLMALFGAPIAHEDHSSRAVHAALGIQRALGAYRDELGAGRGIDFRVRMGLNAGAVVVGKIGDNLRMDYTAVGDTTNLAARLLALAEPGQILVSEDIVKTVGPYFALEPLGEVSVKGKALPIRPYRVEGTRSVRSRLEAESERGLTPLVGREHEQALLRDRFAEAQEGHGQAVFVYGEAGIGKSRLLLECRRPAESPGARWILGRCVSYGHTIAHLPVLDFVRDLFGIKEGDSVEVLGEKIADGVREAGDGVSWTAPFLRALLSLDPGDATVKAMIPGQRKGRTAEAVRDLLLAYAAKRPLVLVVEDLHWIDAHSEDILRLLLDGMAAAPLMVVLTYRPGYAQTFGERTYFTRITLHALPEAQTAAMVQRALQGSVPAEVCRLISRKAEGNPLFVEELAKSLVEDGTLERVDDGYRLTRPLADAQIPETIQGVIMARIDRLPEVSKAALQIASVIGREFTARLVERVALLERDARQALGELRTVELIYEKARSPELEYMFKHALTHDVAYESLLRQRRRELHLTTGRVIEELYADRLPEFYETLAFHFTRGEAWVPAVDYLLKSALKARASFDYPEGGRLCAEAIEISQRSGGSPEERGRAHELLGDLEGLQGRLDPANQAYEQALGFVSDGTARRRLGNKTHRPGSIVREGARIVYYEHGVGEPTLVLCHPMTYGLATFQPLLEQLCQDFRVVTWDPRGTGQSDPLPGPYYTTDFMEDLHAVVETIGDRPVVVVGQSRGSTVGAHFATKYPHLVERLVLAGLNVAGGWGRPDAPHADRADMEFNRRLRAAIEVEDWSAVVPLFINQVAAGEAGVQKIIEGAIRFWSQIPLDSLRNFFKLEDPGRDVRLLLPALRVPTLVLHAGHDRVNPVEAARWAAEQIPGAQFYSLEGRSHMLVITAVVEFAQMVRTFIHRGRVTRA
jgi:class 3 adenylate cyclase/pimeloyl-ACP methyl ester carboxylesterase